MWEPLRNIFCSIQLTQAPKKTVPLAAFLLPSQPCPHSFVRQNWSRKGASLFHPRLSFIASLSATAIATTPSFNQLTGYVRYSPTIAMESRHPEADGTDPIAVVGLGCRFPGTATSPEALWEMLVNGESAWSEFPEDRMNMKAHYHPDSRRQGTV